MPAMPKVLFVDDDADALRTLMVRMEPIFLTAQLHSVAPMQHYVEQFRPQVLVLADHVRFRRQGARELVAKVRERGFKEPVVVLTDETRPGDEARWQEWGANAVVLHPTRIEPRIDHLTQQLAILSGLAS